MSRYQGLSKREDCYIYAAVCYDDLPDKLMCSSLSYCPVVVGIV